MSQPNPTDLLSVPEVAKLKGVSPSGVYLAVQEGRLPSCRVLGKIGIRRADAEAWTPISYRGRPGANGRRKPGIPMSEEAKRKLSDSQKERWRQRKQVL